MASNFCQDLLVPATAGKLALHSLAAATLTSAQRSSRAGRSKRCSLSLRQNGRRRPPCGSYSTCHENCDIRGLILWRRAPAELRVTGVGLAIVKRIAEGNYCGGQKETPLNCKCFSMLTI